MTEVLRSSGPMRATIAVLTYRRPADLDVILPALFAQLPTVPPDFEVDVLVVDNDAAGSAADVLAARARPGLRSVVEAEPGIAAARNRALSECDDRDLLIFIDDDESPHDGWLVRLLEQWRSSRPAAVVGAVVSAFDGELDPWLAAGRFFQRLRPPTGTRVEVAATNNLLLDLNQVRALGVRFDVAFGTSGGSDTLFTRQIVARGGVMLWCDEAVVTDRVPTSRMTRSWVLRRALRSGNSWSRTSLALDTAGGLRLGLRARLVAKGLPRLLGGVGQAVAGLLLRSAAHQARGARTAARGAGMVSGAFGYTYREYLRPQPPGAG